MWSLRKVEMGYMLTPASASLADTRAMKPTTDKSRTMSKVISL